MAAPVWVLSVDLQAKTATFQTGLAEAAKSARGAFTDISGGAGDMGEAVSGASTNVRAALGLLDNTIRGNHAAAMADLVREFKDSSLVMTALPFAAVIGGIAAVAGIAVEVAEKIKEWREEQQRLTLEQTKFGTTVNETFNGLDEKIISAEQKADELKNDHIAALGKELELIDRQSFSELMHSFETIAKAADTVFGDLKGHWYTWGNDAAGAKHALEGFQAQYNSLLAQGKDSAASDLLAGTLTSAKAILAAQQQAKANSGIITNNPADTQRVINNFQAAYVKLKAAGVRYTDDAITAQKTLIAALQAQEGSQQRINALKGIESGNAKRTTGGEMSKESSEAAKEAASSQLRINESVLASDRATAQARLEVQHASIEDRLSSEVEFANRQLAIELAGNQAQIAALDKMSKDYPNQLKALEDKSLEIKQQSAAQIATLTAQASVQQAAQDLHNLQESEREKINATQQGSAERLAAIDAAIKEESSHNLQAEDGYRQLLTQRVQTVREMAQQEAEQKAEAGRLSADNGTKLAQLALAAQQEQQALADSSRRMTEQRRIDEEIQAANAVYGIQMDGYNKQIAALDKAGKDYENKLRQIQNQQKQLTQSHENQITQIQDSATISRNQTMLSALGEFESSVAKGLASVLTGHQTFASMMSSIGNQVAQGLIENSLKDIMALDMTKERQAAAAARQMYLAGASLPFPANIVAAPVMAAGAYAVMMAYADGTDMVPGVGRGDTVPAMLTPGEGVVPGGVMDGLRNMVRSGNMGGESATHIHVRYSPQVTAIDSNGVENMLKTHGKLFVKEFHGHLRKMNR